MGRLPPPPRRAGMGRPRRRRKATRRRTTCPGYPGSPWRCCCSCTSATSGRGALFTVSVAFAKRQQSALGTCSRSVAGSLFICSARKRLVHPAGALSPRCAGRRDRHHCHLSSPCGSVPTTSTCQHVCDFLLSFGVTRRAEFLLAATSTTLIIHGASSCQVVWPWKSFL